MSMTSTIIRTHDLWKQYETEGHDGMALRGVDLDIGKGQIVVLFGKSGSGNTTLLNLLAGLDEPTRGRIEIDNGDLGTLGEKGRTLLRRHKLGFVFQFFNLLPTLTAEENVLLSLELAGRPDEGLARESLELVGLAGKERRFPHELSGGEQQRVAIARALVKRPPIILADEPTGNLDSHSSEEIMSILVELHKEQNNTLVMITHEPDMAAYCERIIHIKDGLVLREERL